MNGLRICKKDPYAYGCLLVNHLSWNERGILFRSHLWMWVTHSHTFLLWFLIAFMFLSLSFVRIVFAYYSIHVQLTQCNGLLWHNTAGVVIFVVMLWFVHWVVDVSKVKLLIMILLLTVMLLGTTSFHTNDLGERVSILPGKTTYRHAGPLISSSQ